MQQAALSRRERQVGDGCEIIAVIVVLLFVFCLRKSARSAGDLGVSIEYSCVIILPQIAQRNAASCIITQRKTDWSLCGFGGWGVVCDYLRETYCFLCAN